MMLRILQTKHVSNEEGNENAKDQITIRNLKFLAQIMKEDLENLKQDIKIKSGEKNNQ